MEDQAKDPALDQYAENYDNPKDYYCLTKAKSMFHLVKRDLTHNHGKKTKIDNDKWNYWNYIFQYREDTGFWQKRSLQLELKN